MNTIETRPWGTYEILLDAPNVKVKRIIVNPWSQLSYQYHTKRREQWVVVEGTANVVLDGKTITIKQGESIHIPIEAKHRIMNHSGESLTLIEVQTGTYFGEDDIVRLEDIYGRN